MKKILLFLLLFCTVSLGLKAQESYEFSEIKRVNATSVKSQGQTGTCWAFSTASFLESEALRMGKGEHDLSEMFVVRHIYRQKCENYVRRQGKANLSQGGLAHDLLNAVDAYGIVPESVYPGKKDAQAPHNHTAVEKALTELCDGFVADAQKGKLRADWLTAVDSILDESFGKVPLKFTYNGSVFSPVSFRDYLGIKPADYLNLTSFTHHPFWKPFILEIPDNFSNGEFYNLPINELMNTLNYALQQGFGVEWDGDVSNRGFAARNGLAIVPSVDWADKSEAQRSSSFKYWESEKEVSQNYRQQLFDQQETTDDHLMHIVGMVDEAHSGNFYAIKNSWGEISDLKGYVYTSEAYMRLNTVSITLHKDAVPVPVRQRLGLLADQPVRNKRQEELERSNTVTPRAPRVAKPAKGSTLNSTPSSGKQ